MKGFFYILPALALILLTNACASNNESTITQPDIHAIDGWYDGDSCWVTGTGSPDERIQSPILRRIDTTENAGRDARKLMLEFLVRTYLNQPRTEYDYDTVKNAFIRKYSPLIENGKVTHEKKTGYDSYSVIFVISKKGLKREIMSGSSIK
jgi:hypothetical protein